MSVHKGRSRSIHRIMILRQGLHVVAMLSDRIQKDKDTSLIHHINKTDGQSCQNIWNVSAIMRWLQLGKQETGQVEIMRQKVKGK